MVKKISETPWGRQPGESSQAYEAFSTYRDMGVDRTVVAVGRELAKSRQLIDRWKQANNWDERVRAWDSDTAQKTKAVAEKEAADMVKRHLKLAQQLQDKAALALEQLNTGRVGAYGIAELLKLGVDIERLNRGEVTERIENKNEISGAVTVAKDPYEELTTEELRKLAAMTSNDEGSS